MIRFLWRCLVPFSSTILAAASPGTVYTMTNWASGNNVMALGRGADGTLSSLAFFPTGGAGTDIGLGSQGSLAMTANGQWLLAVNAGSNDITVFSILRDGTLHPASRTLSLGFTPISLTIHGATVFVLNSGAPANLTGFTLGSDGSLTAIPGARRVLTGSGPAEVAFDVAGQLVVTDKQSNLIEVFPFSNGRFAGQAVMPSAGAEPSGFAFVPGNRLIVAEATLGAPHASAVSGYQLDANAHLKLVSRSVPTAQTGAFSVAVTHDGKHAFVSNADSASISSLAVASDGSLREIEGAAGLTLPGTSPADLALSADSTLLYTVASGTLFGFSVSPDGRLTPVTLFGGLPLSSSGLAIR